MKTVQLLIFTMAILLGCHVVVIAKTIYISFYDRPSHTSRQRDRRPLL